MKTISTLLVILFGCTVVRVTADDNMAKINAMFANVKSTSYPAAAFTHPIPLAVGQFVVYGKTDKGGGRGVFRSAIIAHEGDAWTIEITAIEKNKMAIMQITARGLERAGTVKSTADVEIANVRYKTNDDEPASIPDYVVSTMSGIYKMVLGGITSFSDMNIIGEGGDVTVPAGTFKGTTKINSETSIAGESDETTSWSHPAIPIYGFVKSLINEEENLELLDFGLTGATASF